MKKVLFACVHNAGRSQMAAALFNALADPAKVIGISAGTQPGERVHPEVVAAMKEEGFDLSGVKPRALTATMQTEVDFLVTMGCGESCPLIAAPRRVDWPVPDPKGQPLSRVREIRNDLRELVRKLVLEKGWNRT
jgi:arsenate reductase